MLDESNFKKKALKKAKEYTKDIFLLDKQYEIFLEMIKILLKNIPIGEDVMKGVGWKAISNWQKDFDIEYIVIAVKPHEERVNMIEKIFDYAKIELVTMLINSEYSTQVDNAVAEALAFYNENYADL